MPEFCKKICPFRGLRDEDVSLVRIVALSAQIAERAQSVQGACHNGLRNVQRARQSTHRMGAGIQINEEQQRHLPIGQIGLSRPDIIDQRVFPREKRGV